MNRLALAIAALLPAALLRAYVPDPETACIAVAAWGGICGIVAILWHEVGSPTRAEEVARVAMQGFPSAEDKSMAVGMGRTKA